jgi:hypothetical protein
METPMDNSSTDDTLPVFALYENDTPSNKFIKCLREEQCVFRKMADLKDAYVSFVSEETGITPSKVVCPDIKNFYKYQKQYNPDPVTISTRQTKDIYITNNGLQISVYSKNQITQHTFKYACFNDNQLDTHDYNWQYPRSVCRQQYRKWLRRQRKIDPTFRKNTYVKKEAVETGVVMTKKVKTSEVPAAPFVEIVVQ